MSNNRMKIVGTIRSILEATDPYMSTGIQNPEIPINNSPVTPEAPTVSDTSTNQVANQDEVQTSNDIDTIVRGPEDQILNSINKIINLKNKVLDSRSDGEINQLISQQNT